jgi:hypothetical protein
MMNAECRMETRMRFFVVIVAFVAGGITGAAIGGAATFFSMFYVLRAFCWLMHNDSYMLLMWSGLVVEPIALVVGFSFGGALTGHVIGRLATSPEQRGFEVVAAAPVQRTAQ